MGGDRTAATADLGCGPTAGVADARDRQRHLHVLRGGVALRMLPPCLPPRQTIYRWFAPWRDAGVWQTITHHLVKRNREQTGRKASPSAAVIDSQSVKTTEAGCARGVALKTDLPSGRSG